MIAEHPNGTLFVAGYGEPRPTLWRSGDRGATWTRVDVGTEAQGAIGNSDVDLAISRDGTVYFVSMLFDRSVGEGRQIVVGVSSDAGATWSWTTISKTRFDDRPWIEVTPDGAAHVIWNDGSGVSYRMTRDRGVTWSQRARIHEPGGSSHLAVGPNCELAVRIAPASASGHKLDSRVDLIAVSIDGGSSWQKHAAPAQQEWSPLGTPGVIPRWVEPLAWDETGALYSLWTDTTGVRLARSADRGITWTSWQVANSPGASFYPYLVARDRGHLAATWFSTTSPTADLQWHVAEIDVDKGNAAPRVAESSTRSLESWRTHPGQGATLFPDTGGEYIALAFLRDGGIGVVTTIQNPGKTRMGFTWWRFATQ